MAPLKIEVPALAGAVLALIALAGAAQGSPVLSRFAQSSRTAVVGEMIRHRPAVSIVAGRQSLVIAGGGLVRDRTEHEPAPSASTDIAQEAPQQATAPPPAVVAAAPPPVQAPERPNVPASAPPAVPAGSNEVYLINQDRAAAGLPPLAPSSCLAGIARRQALAMATAGQIFHGSGVSEVFACGLGSIRSAENVAFRTGGISDVGANLQFMSSPPHRANILGGFRYAGAAWACAAGDVCYIAVEFG